MGSDKTNDKKGEEAVESLKALIESATNSEILRHCQMKAAEINLFNGRTDLLTVKQVIRANRRAKTDLFVVFKDLGKPLGVSVISAGLGSSNHVERRNVEFYRKDLGLEDDSLRLLQLLTGSLKPNEATSTEVTREPSASEEYIRYCDLTQAAQLKLINQIKLVRNKLATNALLGRGNAVKCKDGKLRADEVSVIAFLDQKNPESVKWTVCDAQEIVDSITADEVTASRDQGNQINLGRAMVLKRYGGGSKKGDTTQKDQLQIQIYPRILYKQSTDFGHYKRVSEQLGLQRLEPESEGTEEVILTTNAKAAKRGLEAEDALADEISQHNPDCRWIVEEATGSNAYSTYKAASPNNNEKPDVVIFPILKPGKIEASLSIKTYRPNVSFGQVNRGSIDMYAEAFKMPNDVLRIFRKYLKKGPAGERTKFNIMSGEEVGKVFLFLKSKQQEILQFIFCGAPSSDQKADWILLHSYTDDNWRARIGFRDNWKLYKLSDVIYACQSVQPQCSPKGDIIIGAGVTAQRKGADKTDKNADDLQFKLSPKAIIELMKSSNKNYQYP